MTLETFSVVALNALSVFCWIMSARHQMKMNDLFRERMNTQMERLSHLAGRIRALERKTW